MMDLRDAGEEPGGPSPEPDPDRAPGRFLLLANPHAGRGLAAKRVYEAAALLRKAGAIARAEITESIDHATALAIDARREGLVPVAVGGDGLVRAVAAGASRHGGTIGIVPAGRGNDFARATGIPTGLDRAVRVLLEASPHPTDCIAVESDAHAPKVALGNVYLGFDSLSNVTANALPVNLGRHSYTYAALRVALTMPPLEFGLTLDGEDASFTGAGVAIASSAFYGGAVRVAPGADPHDGLLDVVCFEQVTRRTRISTMLAMKKGAHLERAGVRLVRAQEIRVTVAPDAPVYSDGDPITTAPFTARVMPGAIGLLRPPLA